MLVSLSEFPRRVRCCPRGLALNLSCLRQASNLAPKRRTVANAVFLALPALEIGLSQLYRVHTVARRNHWDQFWRGGSRRGPESLPPTLPAGIGAGRPSKPASTDHARAYRMR